MQADKISEQRLLEKTRRLVPEQIVLVEKQIAEILPHYTNVLLESDRPVPVASFILVQK